MVERYDVWTQNLIDGLTLGHRSKVKVVNLKNMIFKVSDGLTCADSLFHVNCRHLTLQCDVMMLHDVMIMTSLGKNADKEGMTRQGASMLRCFHYGPLCMLCSYQ